MSLNLWVCGADMKSCHVQLVGCSSAPPISRRQFSLATLGVWPRSRIGQFLTRCCPGGRRASSGREVMPVRNLPSSAHRDFVLVSFESSGVSGTWHLRVSSELGHRPVEVNHAFGQLICCMRAD